MTAFAHRNFNPSTNNIKAAHHLICENCSTPLWKHHALKCPAKPEPSAAVGTFLRRAADWPYLADIGPVEAKTIPTPEVPEVSDPIVGIVNFNGRIIVAAYSGVFELIDNALQRIHMVK